MAGRNIKKAHPVLQAAWPELKRRFEAHCPEFELRVGEVDRSPEEQYAYFKAGLTTIDGYTKKGKHNYVPSKAVDAVIVHRASGLWIDTLRARKQISEGYFYAVYSVFGLIAQALGLRWGNDWDDDGVPVGPDPDEKFVDVYHVEVR